MRGLRMKRGCAGLLTALMVLGAAELAAAEELVLDDFEYADEAAARVRL